MARIVTIFDSCGQQVFQVSGKGDLLVAQIFSEFLLDFLKDRGFALTAEITVDDTKTESNWPNLRQATEQISDLLRHHRRQAT